MRHLPKPLYVSKPTRDRIALAVESIKQKKAWVPVLMAALFLGVSATSGVRVAFAAPACGAPVYNSVTEAGVFLWQDCSDPQLWSVRFTAGGKAISYRGSLSSTSPFESFEGVGQESSDRLPSSFTTPTVGPIGYTQNVGATGYDGFNVRVRAGSEVCFQPTSPLGLPVRIGADRVAVTTPVSLVTFSACGTPSVPRIDVSGSTANEGSRALAFNIRLSTASASLVTVAYRTADGAARAAVDYNALSGTVSFAPGQIEKTVTVSILEDTETEGDEDLRLVLSAPTGGTLGTSSATGVIVDDDSTPVATCGSPGFNSATESGVFLWQDCADPRTWRVRFTAGGQTLSYRGSLTSTAGFSGLSWVSQEASDVLPAAFTTPTSVPIGYVQNVGGSGFDGFDVRIPPGAQICFIPTGPTALPIRVGANRIAVNAPVNLTTLGSCAPPDPTGPLDIVVVLTDDQRWDSTWAMPETLQLLSSRGVRFENAFVTTPLCGPSRASIHSGGLLPQNTTVTQNIGWNGVDVNFLGQDRDTLATTLQGAGYKTIFAGGKYVNGYRPGYIPPGWDRFVNNDEGPAAGAWFDYGITVGSSRETSAVGTRFRVEDQYVTDFHRDQVLDFLDQLQEDDPLFLFFSVYAPHAPAIPDDPDRHLHDDYVYRERAVGESDLSDKPDWVSNPWKYTYAKTCGYPDCDQFARDQLSSLASVDRAISAIIGKLQELGRLDRALVIVTSDNGFMWGEHGLYTKAMAYDESVRVPLLVAMPGVPARTEEKLVAVNLDIGATLFDLIGADQPTDGLSLLPLLDDPTAVWRDHVILQGWGDHEGPSGVWGAVRTEQWKYIENAIGETELYDLSVDPWETESQHLDTASLEVQSDLESILDSSLGLTVRTLHTQVPSGRVGVPYRFQLEAWGGTPPYRWSLHSGTLPAGLRLDPNTGRISGTPTVSDAQSVYVLVEDSSERPRDAGPQRFIAPGLPAKGYRIVINP